MLSRVELGEWLPDRPDYPNQGAIEVRNCIPQAESYRELLGYTAVSSGVGSSETILNAIWTEESNQVEIIAGTATRLLRLNGTSWTTIGSGYNVTSWEFVRFGSFVYAVAPNQATQVVNLAGAGTFADATGTPSDPPNGRRIGVVRDFVVIGNLDSDDRTIQWSGFNNAGIWDPNGNTQFQADSQPLLDGGAVQKIVSGPYGYIFQERAVRAMEYIGPPPIFNIQPIDRARGAVSGDAVIAAGDRVFFYAQDGFFMVQGRTFTPIGAERVNRWFLSEADPNEIENMIGAVDRRNRLAFWGFKTSTDTKLHRLLIYNYSVDRWSYADISDDNITTMAELRTVGYSIDELGAIIPGGVDSVDISVDTEAYSGGSLLLFAGDTSGQLGTFTGAAKTAVIDTHEFDGGNNRRLSTSSFRPLVEGSGTTVVTVSLGVRDLLTATPQFGAAESLNSVGEAPILSDARYHRTRLNISGGFTHARAVDVFGRPSGRF